MISQLWRPLHKAPSTFCRNFSANRANLINFSRRALKDSHYFEMNQADGVPYFGKEVVNRVSFLREDSEFITSAALHPSTRFVIYENASPLINTGAGAGSLVIFTNGSDQLSTVPDDARICAGPASVDESEASYSADSSATSTPNTGLYDFSPQWREVLESWAADNKAQAPDMRSAGKPSFLFLGLKDESVGVDLRRLRSYDYETYLDHQGRYRGIPYFGVDVTGAPEIAALLKNYIVQTSAGGVAEADLVFTDLRKYTGVFSPEEAGLFSHAKMYFDWLGRNRFCPGCGSVVIGIHAGGKLKCTNRATTVVDGETKSACPVQNTSVSNVSFPRTDAVVITAITNRERTKTLLSLGKRYAQKNMYSATAGFMEPSETVEVATKREIWEETGVVCSDIKILMTQPWPFPGNLMIGCVATVDFNGVNEVIHLGHDRELADARWFDVNFVKKLMDGTAGDENPEGIQLPSDISIAYNIIKHVIDEGEASS